MYYLTAKIIVLFHDLYDDDSWYLANIQILHESGGSVRISASGADLSGSILSKPGAWLSRRSTRIGWRVCVTGGRELWTLHFIPGIQ